jgi:hypothetical protein
LAGEAHHARQGGTRGVVEVTSELVEDAQAVSEVVEETDRIESVPGDPSDARNHGVTQDRRVQTRAGHLVRLVAYTDPQSGEHYEFLTNEMDLPPGVIVELSRRRWEAEKVFDQIKNKLAEKKAWATSRVAKEAQAQLVEITPNF